jgi:hypothetical protein
MVIDSKIVEKCGIHVKRKPPLKPGKYSNCNLLMIHMYGKLLKNMMIYAEVSRIFVLILQKGSR